MPTTLLEKEDCDKWLCPEELRQVILGELSFVLSMTQKMTSVGVCVFGDLRGLYVHSMS